MKRYILLCLLLLPAQLNAADVVRVYLLAGQSNMEGKATNKLYDHQATDAKTAKLFTRFRKDDKWVKRDDVFIKFLQRHGELTLGYGNRGRTGLELAFGTTMDENFKEPVLLIKAAYGGHSLFEKFRPPSAGMPSKEFLANQLKREQDNIRRRNERQKKRNPKRKPRPLPELEDVTSRYGMSYKNMMNEVRTTQKHYQKMFPALKGKKLKFSGFVWFQGWNDQYGGRQNHYAENMRHFINDVRKDLNEPKLPFVIAVMGQNGSTPAKGAMRTIQEAQLAMQHRPEFKGNVMAVRTDLLVDKAAEKLYPKWRKNFEKWKLTGSDFKYHYMGSAIWFNRIGDATASAMLKLQGK